MIERQSEETLVREYARRWGLKLSEHTFKCARCETPKPDGTVETVSFDQEIAVPPREGGAILVIPSDVGRRREVWYPSLEEAEREAHLLRLLSHEQVAPGCMRIGQWERAHVWVRELVDRVGLTGTVRLLTEVTS